MATPEEGAREIMRIAVRELGIRANGLVTLEPVLKRFTTAPWRGDELMPAVVFAQQRGWLTQEGHLTSAGFMAAP